MTTFAEAIAERRAHPIVIVTIAGVGEYAGQWKFVTRAPRLYSASPRYKPWLTQIPDITPEEGNPLGGVMAAGELAIELVDVEDALTSLLRVDAVPQTTLSAAAAVGASTLTFTSAAGITAGASVVWVGREAVLVDSLSSGTTYNVTKGALDTDDAAHVSGDEVSIYIRGLYGRRMRLYVAFDDVGYSVAEEANGEIGGGWHVDRIAMGAGLSTWILRGRSQLKYLDRLIYRAGFLGFLGGTDDTGDLLYLVASPRPNAGVPNEVQPHFQDRVFFKVGDEIIRGQFSGVQLAQIIVEHRAVAGTRAEQWELSDPVRQVFVADTTDGYGSFRYQDPGAETSSRSTGTWTPTDHPVPIILALLTSPSDATDETPNNYATATGNYSALPGGIGLGVPMANIDAGSFLDVWHRTQNYALPYLVLDETRTGRELIDEICRLCGYVLHTSGDQISLTYARTPIEGETGTSWGAADILTEQVAEGVARPRLSIEWDTTLTAGSVVFETKTSRGDTVKSVFTDASFPELFGNTDGLYESEDQRIELPAHFVRSDVQGGEPEVLRQRALQLLFRYRRPLLRIALDTDLSHDAVEPGSLVQLTHAQIPDLALGTRGVTDLVCLVTAKRVEVSEDFVGIHWVLISFGCGRVGRICPSGRIASVATNTATLTANRYSDTSARGGLPATDAAGFTVGDRVRLVSRAGVPVATTPAYQSVSSIGSNTLTLDGNFGAAAEFTGGHILEYVNRDSQVAAQYDSFVSMADEANRTVGASSQTPWTWGEP